MLVATSNIHAGVDGYGRRTGALDATLDLGADLLFVQELFVGAEDQAAAIEAAGYQRVAYESLATCTRFTNASGGKGWEPPLGLLSGDQGLYFDANRSLSPRRVAERDARQGGQVGQWGVGLFTRHEILSVELLPVRQLRRDKTGRTVIVAHLRNEVGREYRAVAIHGAHLSHGSLPQYREIARELNTHDPLTPTILAGDFNCWRPLLRMVLPKWRSGVRARTWPAWMPHSQIDHILLRGPWRVSEARAVRTGSDHRALVAQLDLA